MLVAEFASDTLPRQLRQLGFNRVITGRDWEQIPLGPGFSLRIVRDPSLYRTDSFLLIEAGDWTILNQSDCHIPEGLFDHLSLLGIDLLLTQMDSPSWYPHVYRHEATREAELTTSLRAQAIDDLARLVRGTKSRHVILPAHGPVFLGSPAAEPSPPQLFGETQLVGPGDVAILSAPSELQISRAPDRTVTQTLKEYRSRLQPEIDSYFDSLAKLDPNLIERFAQYLDRLFAASPYLRDRVEAIVEFRLIPGPKVELSTVGTSIWVEFLPGAHHVMRAAPGPANLELILPAGVAGLLADGIETWDSVLLSRRLTLRATPDVYNWPLFALLRYGHDRNLLYLVERAMRKGEFETAIVEDAGQRYRIQRYCPHAGEDLTLGRFVDGQLVCPGHSWRFDLRNGGVCTWGGSLRLKVAVENS